MVNNTEDEIPKTETGDFYPEYYVNNIKECVKNGENADLNDKLYHIKTLLVKKRLIHQLNSAMRFACKYNNLEAVIKLLEFGIPMSDYAIESDTESVFKYIQENTDFQISEKSVKRRLEISKSNL